jgi:hypothetical protein
VQWACCCEWHRGTGPSATGASLRDASIAVNRYASEPAFPATLSSAERLLEQHMSIDASQVMMIHLNLGTMLSDAAALRLPRWSHVKQWARHSAGQAAHPPVERLRQGYWHSLLWQLSAGRKHRSGDCASSRNALQTASTGPGPKPGRWPQLPDSRFLLLGGAPKLFRGFAMLEMARRGLLQHGRWSAARFAFCDSPSPVQAYDSSPFGLEDQRQLLSDAALVRSFCARLPKILDVEPSRKTEILAGGDERLWQGTRRARARARVACSLHFVSSTPARGCAASR